MGFSPNRLVHYTPLRYPGGKGKLVAYLKAIMQKNELLDGHYVEAYAGGAGVAVELLLHEFVTHIHINDISRPLYAFWTSVLNRTDQLARKIQDTRLTIRSWDHQKKILSNADDHDDLDVGFALFFLNRTNRSGILNGGVIGGRDQSGRWKIDARYNSRELIARVEAIAALQARISVYNEDAIIFLRRLLPELPAKTLVYLDPPYYVKGKALYPDYYSHDDHVQIARYIGQVRRHKWVVSYDDVPAIREMYSRFRGIQYELGYSARETRKGVEVMFFCDSLQIPVVVGPIAALSEIPPVQNVADETRRRPMQRG